VSDPRIDQDCSLLQTHRRRFEAHAAADLHGLMLVSTDIRMSSSWSPPKADVPAGARGKGRKKKTEATPSGPTPGEQPGLVIPIPSRLLLRPVIDEWETTVHVHHKGPLVRKTLFYGDPKRYSEYRELARSAWPVLRRVLDPLFESPAGPRLLEVFHGELQPGHYPEASGLDDSAYWSLAVFGLLDLEDQGAGTLIERWTYIPPDRRVEPDGKGELRLVEGPVVDVPIPPYETGTERELARRHRTVSFVTINDMFASSAIAIGAIRRLLGAEPATQEAGASHAHSGPVGPDSTSSPGYLGLVPDEKNRRVTREGVEAPFRGKKLAWKLFLELWKNGKDYMSEEIIYERVWGHKAGSSTPDKVTIRRTVTDLRKLIKPLGVTVESNQQSAYCLVPIPPEVPPPSGPNNSRTKLSQ
jgi:hypothetical protein